MELLLCWAVPVTNHLCIHGNGKVNRQSTCKPHEVLVGEWMEGISEF